MDGLKAAKAWQRTANMIQEWLNARRVATRTTRLSEEIKTRPQDRPIQDIIQSILEADDIYFRYPKLEAMAVDKMEVAMQEIEAWIKNTPIKRQRVDKQQELPKARFLEGHLAEDETLEEAEKLTLTFAYCI